MGVGAGLYMCDVVKKSSRWLSHLLMSSWLHSDCSNKLLFMAALRSRCGHYIFALWFLLLSSFFFFSSPNFSVAPYFYTWCGISANLGRRSEMRCTRLAGNTEHKNDAKNRHMGTIAQLCWAVSLLLRHISTIG